ncbi:uncharacterized protein ACWYII_028209 isoform 1-T1 [Salvelinus alpinus]
MVWIFSSMPPAFSLSFSASSLVTVFLNSDVAWGSGHFFAGKTEYWPSSAARSLSCPCRRNTLRALGTWGIQRVPLTLDGLSSKLCEEIRDTFRSHFDCISGAAPKCRESRSTHQHSAEFSLTAKALTLSPGPQRALMSTSSSLSLLFHQQQNPSL